MTIRVVWILLFVFTLGLKNPYLALMEANITKCKTHADALGFDAFTAYGNGYIGTAQVNSV